MIKIWLEVKIFSKKILVFKNRINRKLKAAILAFSILPFISNAYIAPNISATVSGAMDTKSVSVFVDGGRINFNTKESILKIALSEKEILVEEEDFVKPSIDTKLHRGINDILIRRAVPVTVIDEGKIIVGRSGYLSAEDILKDLSINLYANDEIKVADPLKEVSLGLKINIDRADVVNLQVDGNLREIHTRITTVANLLYSENIVLGERDRVIPSIDTKITDGLTVQVIRVIESENSEIVDIPFSVQYKLSSDMLEGETKIEKPGEIGKKEVAFRNVTENGVEISREIISENVIKQSVTQIVIRGTRPKITFASGSYSDLINDAARKYGVNAAKMQRMMMCESGGNPYSVGGGGKFHGLFQYLHSTWRSSTAGAGYQGASIYDPGAQIYTTAWKISRQGYGAWPVCGRR